MRWLGSAMPDLVAARVLEGWEVPQQARDGLLEGDGADQVREIHDVLRILLPIGTANGWMMRANDQALFGVEPPMRGLLEPGGLAVIHRLLLEQLEAR